MADPAASAAGRNDSEAWREAYPLFEQALDLPEPERAGFVSRATHGRDDIRRIVLDLLAASGSGSGPAPDAVPAKTGMRLGRYQVLERLGRGAMGMVYSARDTELGRLVALKFLSTSTSSNSTRASGAGPAERLIAEAQAASSLNHPHIVTVYELVRDGGETALAMELVDGESLRLFCGPEAPAVELSAKLEWARQIAQALAATHSLGVVHRDIKPENIMIRKADGIVKVLDFGLARRVDPDALAGSGSAGGGVLAGTLRYMSPEQTRGAVPSSESDVFSFGVVLAELLYNRHPFAADSPIETAHAIANLEPVLPDAPSLPAALRELLGRMLAKDTASRPPATEVERILHQSAMQLERPAGNPPPPPRRLLAIAGLVLVLLLALILWFPRFGPPLRNLFRRGSPVARLQLSPPDGSDFRLRIGGFVAVSPNGAKVAVHVDGGERGERIVVRDLSGGRYIELPGSENGATPFFSPDGGEIGFYSPTGLQVHSLRTGATRKLVPFEMQSDSQGAVWSESGEIFFATSGGHEPGLYSIRPDQPGRPRLLYRFPADGQEFLFPRAIRGDRLLVASVRFDRRLGWFNLKTGQFETILDPALGGRLLPSGHLVYYRDSQLFATRMDASLQLQERVPVPLIQGVEDGGWYGGYYDVSPEGTLAYLAAEEPQQFHLVWVDLQGRETLLPAPPAGYEPVSISPDGASAAIVRYDNPQKWSLFSHDFRKGTWILLTSGAVRRGSAAWSPDGRFVAFPSKQDGSRLYNNYVRDLRARWDDPSAVQRLTREETLGQIPQDWTRHGDMLVYAQGTHPQTGGDLYAVRRSDPARPILVAGGPGFQSQAAVSPDGRWLAYRDCAEVCSVKIRPFLRGGEPFTISYDGARGPMWSPSGDTLYFISGNFMTAAPISAATGRPRGPSRQLFPVPYLINSDQWGRSFALSPDGKRFLFAKAIAQPQRKRTLHVIRNWAADLDRLVP